LSELAHIVLNRARDPVVCLLLVILLFFLLIIPSSKNLVGPRHNRGPIPHRIAVFHEQRQMSFDAFLIGVFAYPAVCRDVPNQRLVYRVGI